MIRLLACLLAPLLASELEAMSAHRCSAPLILPYDAEHPEPELTFALTLDESATPPSFAATGHHYAAGQKSRLNWAGVWTRYEGGLQMIGTAEVLQGAHEWRAEGIRVHDDVMILNLERDHEDILMVRCLAEWGE